MKNVYDYSQLSCYQTCPYKFYLRYVVGLKKIASDDTNMDIEFGSCVHSFLEKWYRKENVNLNDVWKDYTDRPDELAKTKHGGITLCTEYHKHYLEHDRLLKVVSVEEVIELPYFSCPFVVKLDTIVNVNNNNYSLEHKTTSNISPWYFKRYEKNMQISAQTAAVEHKCGQCSGVIINAIEAKFLKRKSAYRDAGFNAVFERHIENRTADEIEDFKWNAERWISQIEEARELNLFPKASASSACSAYRGCSYKELCKVSVGKDVNEEIAELLYEKLDDPLDYLKEEK